MKMFKICSKNGRTVEVMPSGKIFVYYNVFFKKYHLVYEDVCGNKKLILASDKKEELYKLQHKITKEMESGKGSIQI